MAERAWTAGPWVAELSGNLDGGHICVVAPKSGTWICRNLDPGESVAGAPPYTVNEAWGNARLIAESPALYEALAELVAANEVVDKATGAAGLPDNEYHDALGAAYRRQTAAEEVARAVLARARGDSPSPDPGAAT